MLPKGIKSSGFPAVEAVCSQIGIEFDPWQRDLNRCLLAKDRHGLYAADTVALSISRQVGKTFDIGAVIFALCIAQPGLTVVWTAHRFKVARESFNEMRGWAKLPELSAHIDYDDITTAAGNECIPFRNGSRIVFAARERGAIRGFTKVGVLVLDEAQILTEAALADLAPTLNQASNPLIVLMGTPPKPSDPSEVFTRIRREALAGESDGVLYVELAADPGSDPNDRKQWAKANPSYPKRTPAKAILRLQKLLSPDDFDREARGIWDSEVSTRILGNWSRCAAPEAAIVPRSLGIAVSFDRSMTSIAGGGEWDDGVVLGAVDRRPGTAWVAEEAGRLQTTYDCDIVIDKLGPAASLIPVLEGAGVRVTVVDTKGYCDACATLFDAVDAQDVRHADHPDLNMAVAVAAQKPVGDGRWVWARRGSAGDVSMLEAATLAWSASTQSVYEARDMVTV